MQVATTGSKRRSSTGRVRSTLSRVFRLLVVAIAAASGAFTAAAAAIAVDGLTSEARPADVIVVLGNEVYADGTPSPRLAARLDTAAALYRDGRAEHIIVSGGIGTSGSNEAKAMRDYLVDSGLVASEVIVDSEGLTTGATAKNSAAIMNERQWRSVIVVSQYFHLSRTKLAFSRNGIDDVSAAPANYYERRDAYSLAREVVAYGKYATIGG